MPRSCRLLSLTTLLVVSAAGAGAADHRHRVTTGLHYVAVGGSLEERFGIFEFIDVVPAYLSEDVVSRMEAEDSNGWFVAYEFRAGRRLGFELATGSSNHDVQGPVTGTATLSPFFGPSETVPIEGSTRATIRIRPIALAAHWHLPLGRRGEIALGPVFARVRFGDLRIDDWSWTATFPINAGSVSHFVQSEPLPVETDLAWGLTAVLEIPLGKHGWSLSAGTTYLPAEADFHVGDAKRSIGLDPILVRLGISKGFGAPEHGGHKPVDGGRGR